LEVLFELALHGLEELQQGARSWSAHHVIETMRLSALDIKERIEEQGDMFQRHARSDAKIEATLTHLTRRLGAEAVTVPVIHDDRCPERSGSWVPIGTSQRPQEDLQKVNSGVRLLDPPLVLRDVIDDQPQHIITPMWTATVKAWHGPERLSGHWWADDYDRDYYWVSTLQGQMLWIYRDRMTRCWVLQGWLD
jgi:hypothetical protein